MHVQELVNALKDQIAEREKKIEQLKAALSALGETAVAGAKRGPKKGSKRGRRKMSKAARARIADAHRWWFQKNVKGKKQSHRDEAMKKSPKKRRKMSKEARARIAEAQRKRWAKIKGK